YYGIIFRATQSVELFCAYRILIEIEKCDFLWQNTRKMRKSRVRVFMILLDILKGYVIEEISSMRDRRK
ncbi:MAG: hypothetical protein ACLTMR_10990, partial [Faecalibacillus sp.]